VISDRSEVFSKADVILQIRAVGTNPESDSEDLKALKKGKIVIGLIDALSNADAVKSLASSKVWMFFLHRLI